MRQALRGAAVLTPPALIWAYRDTIPISFGPPPKPISAQSASPPLPQPLADGVRSDGVEAVMNYQSAGVSEISGSETGTSIAGSSWLPQRVLIRDGRRASKPHTLDLHGFALLADAKALHPNYYDETAVVNGYYEQCESLLAKQTGAKLVVAFDHNVRCDAAKATGRRLRNGNRVEGAAALVHNDYTAASAKRRLSMLSEPPSRALKAELVTKLHDKPPLERQVVEEALDGKRRFAFVNVWRPIVPVECKPLGCVDAMSVSSKDLVTLKVEHTGGQSQGGIYFASHQPQHSWWYYPSMSPDEVLLVKQWDSHGGLARGYSSDREGGKATFSLHSAFADPTTLTKGPLVRDRESIECRCVLVW